MTSPTSDILGVVDETTQRQYSYYLTNLATNETIAELPFKDVTYATTLSGVGDFNGSIAINQETNIYDVRRSTLPGQIGLYVLRDSRPVWGGIVWKRRYSASTRTVDVVASTFESYLERRLQPNTFKFLNDDQMTIARWLLLTQNPTTGKTVADSIRASVSTVTSPISRERQFNGFERKTVLDELTRLGDLLDGFDWNVLIGKHYQSQEITRTFEFFYPRRGVPAESSQLLFEYPGSIRDFNTDEDAQAGANIMYALGIGEGIDQKSAVAVATDQISAGLPELEDTRSYSSVSLQTTLQAHADADLNRLKPPVTIFDVTVDARTEPTLGSYEVGDWARFILKDEFITPAIDRFARITAIEVSVDGTSGLEQVKLTLGGDEVGGDEDEGAW